MGNRDFGRGRGGDGYGPGRFGCADTGSDQSRSKNQYARTAVLQVGNEHEPVAAVRDVTTINRFVDVGLARSKRGPVGPGSATIATPVK